jgi:predicted O-methyltransferase YrrM
VVKRHYEIFHPKITKGDFVGKYFDSRREYKSYTKELDKNPVSSFLKEAEACAQEKRNIDSPRSKSSQEVYAYLRKYSPEIVVETGVRDGWSTLYILCALFRNQSGKLYSIDYPIRAENQSEKEEQYLKEAPSYEKFTPTIPPGTDPGWIVPEDLRDRWELHLGKSQTVLPKLFTQIDEIDVFIHDSDHSLPCMVFEYELAWEWLSAEGLIFSDDITWNDGFKQFVDSKGCSYGRISNSFGYLEKQY